MPVHPTVIRPEAHAVFSSAGMGKSTVFTSPRVLVGVNAFEPGQEPALHAHAGMDKVYHVVAGEGLFLLEGGARRVEGDDAGSEIVAPAVIGFEEVLQGTTLRSTVLALEHTVCFRIAASEAFLTSCTPLAA